MLSWTPYPFIRIVFFYCLGILVGIYFPEAIAINLVQIALLVLAGSYVLISFLRSSAKLKKINPGLIGLTIILLSGFIQVYYSTDSNKQDHFIHDSGKINYYKALITKQAQEKENSWKIEAEVKAIEIDGNWNQRTGKVLLYFSKPAFDAPFKYGDVFLIKNSPTLLNGPANPGEFDYRNFLTYRKVYHQHFLRDGEAIKIGREPPDPFIEYSIQARTWAQDIINRYVEGDQERATASALVLGVTDGLDNDLIGAYAATGSLHVLSVSGLHVGIIYWLILLLLKPLTKTTSGKWMLAFLSIAILWGYAFITGLSPSVLRAVTMFSFVAIAQPWSKRTNIYNTLAASAFCLLLYEPYLIMSVGFQLSYLAVVGIVYLQPVFSRLWEPKSWLWDNVWQITCVSIAAQLATFALGLLYFHQFPVYFLFSNLFVIPTSFVVLVLGIVLIIVGAIDPLAGVIGFLLEWTIKILNVGVYKMESLPFSLIDNVYITTLQCWLMIGIIIFSIILIKFRKFRAVLMIAVCTILFSVIQWNHFGENINKQKLTVYNVGGHSAVDFFDRGIGYFLTDSVLLRDKDKIRFHIRPNRLRSGVDVIHAGDHDFVRQFKGCRLLLWNEISILQIQEKDFSFPDIDVNYVLVSNNSVTDITNLTSIKFEKLILDSSNSFYLAEKILQNAEKSTVSIFSVLHQGAFVAKL